MFKLVPRHELEGLRHPHQSFTWLLVAACSAMAATAAEDRIAEVIVSASRIGAVDQLAAVLEEEDLLAGFHGADALWTLPGLALSAAGNRGAITQARLRGAEANHLLVLFDGVAVNDPATGSEFNFGALDLTGVRRVELLAGPQSAVWGSDALAGVLHFDSTPKRSGRRLALGWGSHGTVDADAAFARVDGKNLRAISVGRVRSDGTNAALSGSEADGFANTTAHLRADTERGAWALSSVARWSEADAHYDPTPPPRFVPQDGDRRGETRAKLLLASARFVGFERFEPWLTVSTLRTGLRNLADGDVTNTFAGRRDSATLAANLHHGRQRFNLTAEVRTEHFAQRADATPYGDPNQRQRATTASVAAEHQARLGGFAFTVSARRDFNDQFKHAFAYRLGATTNGNPRWFISVGRGVKNPTFIERFGYAPDAFLGNPNLLPETSRGVEAGVAWQWERGELSLTAFDNALRREIDGFHFDAERGAFTARNLPGKSRRRGGEARFAASWNRLRLQGAYSYTDAADRDSGQEVRRPRHLANLSARWKVTPRLSAKADVAHTGASADRDYSTFPATRVTLPGFELLRLQLAFAPTPGWRLRLLVDNALDAAHTTVFGYRGPGRATMLTAEVAL